MAAIFPSAWTRAWRRSRPNPDLYAEVIVGTTSLGATKLGAVPYAVEAAHATSADTAAIANSVPYTGITAVPNATYSVATTAASFVTTSTSFVDVPNLTATLTTHGSPVLLTANLNFNPATGLVGSVSSWGSSPLPETG